MHAPHAPEVDEGLLRGIKPSRSSSFSQIQAPQPTLRSLLQSTLPITMPFNITKPAVPSPALSESEEDGTEPPVPERDYVPSPMPSPVPSPVPSPAPSEPEQTITMTISQYNALLRQRAKKSGGAPKKPTKKQLAAANRSSIGDYKAAKRHAAITARDFVEAAKQCIRMESVLRKNCPELLGSSYVQSSNQVWKQAHKECVTPLIEAMNANGGIDMWAEILSKTKRVTNTPPKGPLVPTEVTFIAMKPA